LLRSEISRMPGVERITTTVGLKTIKRRGMIMPCVRS
jgi:Lrp/AsnC family transcriptional regulator, leucine-responsive regulatory protein